MCYFSPWLPFKYSQKPHSHAAAAAQLLQLCLTLSNPMDCSPPGSSVHGILQPRIQEWVAIPFSRGSSQLRDWTCISCFMLTFKDVCLKINLIFDLKSIIKNYEDKLIFLNFYFCTDTVKRRILPKGCNNFINPYSCIDM